MCLKNFSDILLVRLTMLKEDSRTMLEVHRNLSKKAMIFKYVTADEMNEVLIYL